MLTMITMTGAGEDIDCKPASLPPRTIHAARAEQKWVHFYVKF